MFSKVNSCAIHGVDGCMIAVEADVKDGLPMFTMVGYLSSSVREAAERVRTALKNSGYYLPPKRITVNLSPADMRKEGSGFDLPIAMAVLFSMGITPKPDMDNMLVLGELSLDGSVKSVSGVLPMVICAYDAGLRMCIVPKENEKEAALVRGMQVIGVSDLKQAMDFMQGNTEFSPVCSSADDMDALPDIYDCDFSDVKGQESLKRGMEIAAAGFHNVLLTGAAGAGKSMLVKRLPTIMPAMTFEEKLAVTKIYSVGGILPQTNSIVQQRPFRAPHHTITDRALIGGGRNAVPGEVSFAQHGVLFLDELPEFQKSVLEVLRQPMEEHIVRISRVNASYIFPADFMLVAAMNPCPCGNYPDRRKCCCTLQQIQRYQNKISGPLLDRIDIRMEVCPVKQEELFSEGTGETSETIRMRVEQARMMQKKRYEGERFAFNSQLDGKNIGRYIKLSPKEEQVLMDEMSRQELSVRGMHRILKLARTIADLDGSEAIKTTHLQEAFFYRNQNVFIKEGLYGV